MSTETHTTSGCVFLFPNGVILRKQELMYAFHRMINIWLCTIDKVTFCIRLWWQCQLPYQMWEEGALVLLVCLFCLSTRKPTLLGIETCSSLIADGIKGDVCEQTNTLSDCSIASQTDFTRIYIPGSQHFSVPDSACFIIIINIPFCHVSHYWFKVVESTSMFWKQKKEVKNLSLHILQSTKCISNNRCYWTQSFHCLCLTVFV